MRLLSCSCAAFLILSAACSAPPCRTVEGAVQIKNSLDAEALADVCIITGELKVSAPDLTALSLPRLVSVGGELSIVGKKAALATLSLPVLQKVAGLVNISGNPKLAELSLPALETIGESLSVFSNPAMATLSLPALTTVRLGHPRSILISDNGPALKCTGALLAADAVKARGYDERYGGAMNRCP